MILGLRYGHSVNAIGAVGVLSEVEEMRQLFVAIRDLMTSYGHTVIDCNSFASSEGAELREGANKANAQYLDLFISLHLNSYNGSAHGTEMLVHSRGCRADATAQRLTNNMSSLLGTRNRGVKYNSTLFEMRNVNAPNIISELFFCDNASDCEKYNSHTWAELAHAFCNALDGNIPYYPPSAEPAPPADRKAYIITNYLPNGYWGDGTFEGVDIEYINSYMRGNRWYMKGNSLGVWAETCTLYNDEIDAMKDSLGSWVYQIVEVE